MTTTVPRRHRKANREAEQNLEDEFAALEHQVHVELASRPAEPVEKTKRVPFHEREMLVVARPIMRDPKGVTARGAKVAANRVAHHSTHADIRAHTFFCAVGRGAQQGVRWVRDYVKMPKRQMVLERLVAEGDSKKHAKLAARYELRRKRNLKRVATAGGASVGAFLGLPLVVALWLARGDFDVDAGVMPDVGTVAWRWLVAVIPLVVAALVALAVAGREKDPAKRATAAAVVPGSGKVRIQKLQPKPTTNAVHLAFHHAGIEGVVEELAPHREGPGWETLVRIPIGRDTFDTAAAKRATIAGNLGLNRERLFLDPVKGDRGSEKLVRVWQADTDPMAGDPQPHPLLDPAVTEWDLWKQGWPLGVDPRGKQVLVPVVHAPFGVIGARPDAGKTFTMLGLGATVGLAPLFNLDCISFKASDDFKPLKPLVKACGGTYIVGSDEKAFEAFHKYLKQKRVEYVARYTRLGALPIEAVPHGKLTRAIAEDARMQMPPGVALCDEIQTALLHSTWGPKILEELIELARTVRALSFFMLFGMQFVDAATVKTLVRLFGFRFALSVARWEDSQGILGGAHKPGVADASDIPLSRKGVGIVAGAEDDPTLGARGAFQARTYGLDRVLLAQHVNRCLTGCRAGATPALTLVKDTEHPFRATLRTLLQGEEAVTCMVLAGRHGLGETPAGSKALVDLAREAGIEPRKDTSGRVTGKREALYIAAEQLA